MNRIAYFGGTFDPIHNGHLAIAKAVSELFKLDRFLFLPAFHAPHKPDTPPTSSFHRFAMLCMATQDEPRIMVSTLELNRGEKRYTVDTLRELHDLHPGQMIFFVMGADSWEDICTWRDWENVLLSSNHIVVTRPGYKIGTKHVSETVRSRIIDLRSSNEGLIDLKDESSKHIYFTDVVKRDISATELRVDLSDGDLELTDEVPPMVAKYIEKYELYR